MNKCIGGLMVAAFVTLFGMSDGWGHPQEPVGKLNLTILYAGEVGSPRTAEWVDFLTGYFSAVETIQVKDLSEESAADADVIIIDAPSPYKSEGVRIPKGAELSVGFTKPTILMGAVGGSTLGHLDIKLDWL